MTEKPTFTDTIIPYSSIHPTQHKYAAIRLQYNRQHTYKKRKNIIGKNVIHNIPYHNSFPIQTRKIPNPKKNQKRKSQLNIPKQIWLHLHIGKETTYEYITTIFKCTNIKVAYLTNYTIQENLTHTIHNHEKFPNTGVYNLTCPGFGKAYMCQKV